MATDLRPEDIEVFVRAVVEYFGTTTGERAAVRSAWLPERAEPLLRDDYNGLIAVDGAYIGSVCFSAPQRLLDHVLLAVGERNFTQDYYLDAVGEIANTLAGRARQHFGDGLAISPPYAFTRDTAPVACHTSAAIYAIPIVWRRIEANLVVQLNRK